MTTENGKLRIDVRKIPMSELFKIKQETGRSITSILVNQGTRGLDEEMLAGLVWVSRLPKEPDLKFQEVFSKLDLSAIMEAEIVVGDEEEESNPPVEAATSTTPPTLRPSAGSTESETPESSVA